jgi:two-component system, NtrC family, sensor kinase
MRRQPVTDLMMKKLVLQEIVSQQRYEITSPCILGRGGKSQLAFPDPAISEQHALVEEIGGRFYISDVGSTNGVFVNDLRITSKVSINQGDAILLGRTTFVVAESPLDISAQTVILHTVASPNDESLDQQRLKLIIKMTASLSEKQDMATLQEEVLPQFKEIFGQDRGCIAIFEKDGTLKPLFADASLESVPLSRSIISRLLHSGESFVLEDALSDASLKEQESILGLSIRSALCVPLTYRERIYGLIYLDRNIPGAFKRDDLEFLRAIASIIAPIIENARLLSELKELYAGTSEALKEAQARLLDRERTSAYIRLAQAMAHEIRNPLMAIGGLVKRIARTGSETSNGVKFQAVIDSVERIDTVLRKVDQFVRFPALDRRLVRIDHLIQEAVADHDSEWQSKGIQPHILVKATNLMIPVDSELIREAISLIIKEIFPSLNQGSGLKISLVDSVKELVIQFGEIAEDMSLCDLLDPELERTPWSLGLFVNLAYKIVTDHGGRLLVDPQGHSPFPLLVTLPRTILSD